MTNIGTINLNGSVVVTDPCYENYLVWHNCHFEVKPGNYRCLLNLDLKNDRVRGLRIQHESIKKPRKLVYIGKCGVDSGQLGIFDENYYISHHTDTDYDNLKSWYRQICDMTSDGNFGTLDSGVVSCSGYGDGMYGVYGSFDKDQQLNCIDITFY